MNFHLRVAPKYVDLLASLPDFADATTKQLFALLPERYRRIIPAGSEKQARAAIIGMLATEAQIERRIGMKFLERVSW